MKTPLGTMRWHVHAEPRIKLFPIRLGVGTIESGSKRTLTKPEHGPPTGARQVSPVSEKAPFRVFYLL